MRNFLVVFLVLFLVGCGSFDDSVVTLIDESDNCVSSVSYPKTSESKLNRKIKRYVKSSVRDFNSNYCSDDVLRQELNIDFKSNLISDRYLNVVLVKTIEDEVWVKTFIFDVLKHKELSIYDILTDNDLMILSDKVKRGLGYDNIEINDLGVQFDDEFLYVYVGDSSVSIPLEELDLRIKISKDLEVVKSYQYKSVSKVIDPNGKVIALTFDDGPSRYTRLIVDLLNEYGASATFFVLGNKVSIYSDTLKYVLDSGNEIGNHSYSHKWLTHVSEEELISQINQTQDVIFDTLGYTPRLVRPTYGSVNQTIKDNVNLDIVLWNVDTLDWKYRNSNKIFKNVLPKIDDGKIVLMHDTYEYTYNALKLLLPKLKDLGYQFVTVSELKEVNSIRNELNKNG